MPLVQRTVNELVAAYRASTEYTALAPATRRGYSQQRFSMRLSCIGAR
nr:hypothetical protein [uncultured Rhodopila sp.]